MTRSEELTRQIAQLELQLAEAIAEEWGLPAGEVKPRVPVNPLWLEAAEEGCIEAFAAEVLAEEDGDEAAATRLHWYAFGAATTLGTIGATPKSRWAYPDRHSAVMAAVEKERQARSVKGKP